MKIFISHSSKNAAYGEALVNFLTGLGIGYKEIIFTSNVAYGIPTGKNIFAWLKEQITEKPHVIYLLSAEYYTSVACLNEMGAAWIVENEHTIIFTPGFDIESKEFQNCALDSKEIGFFINNENRLLLFIDALSKSFHIINNSAIRNNKLKELLKAVASIEKTSQSIKIEGKSTTSPTESKSVNKQETKNDKIRDALDTFLHTKQETDRNPLYNKFLDDIKAGKLKDDELILIQYILDTGKIKLRTGWQEGTEISDIKVWEDIKSLYPCLSSTYGDSIRRLTLRKYLSVVEYTSSGNPKAHKLISEIEENLFDFPADILKIINKAVMANKELLL